MATIKDTVASHLSTNWDPSVVGGSTKIPTIDAVGPEDVKRPENYPEAVLVYNEDVRLLRVWNQYKYGDRLTVVQILVTAHTRTGCTKTILDNFTNEVRSVFGTGVTGFDNQQLVGPRNVTQSGGLYQAGFTLHLYEYGVDVTTAFSGSGAAGGNIRAEPIVCYSASSVFTNERLLTLTATDTLGATLKFAADGTYDIGENAVRVRVGYFDDIQLTNPLADAEVADALTLNTISSAGAIAIKPSGDTDDYLEFSSTGTVPQITVIGTAGMYFKSNDTDYVVFYVMDDSTHYIRMYYHKTSHYGVIHSKSGDIRIQPDDDADDYWYFTTVANAPKILGTGGAAAGTFGDASNYMDEFHASAGGFVEHSHGHLDKPALSDLGKIKQKADGKYDWKTLPDYLLCEEDEYEFEDIIIGEDDEGKPIKDKQKKLTGKKAHGVRIGALASVLVKAVRELEARITALEAAN